MNNFFNFDNIPYHTVDVGAQSGHMTTGMYPFNDQVVPSRDTPGLAITDGKCAYRPSYVKILWADRVTVRGTGHGSIPKYRQPDPAVCYGILLVCRRDGVDRCPGGTHHIPFVNGGYR